MNYAVLFCAIRLNFVDERLLPFDGSRTANCATTTEANLPKLKRAEMAGSWVIKAWNTEVDCVIGS